MADLYRKRLEFERKTLWATCRVESLTTRSARTRVHRRARQANGEA